MTSNNTNHIDLSLDSNKEIFHIKDPSLNGILLYLCLFVWTSWPALQGFILKADGAGRTSKTLLIIGLLLFFFNKTISLKKEIKVICWLLFIIVYHAINLQFANETPQWFEKNTEKYFYMLFQFLFFIFYIYMLHFDFKKTLWMTLISIWFFCFVYVYFSETAYMYNMFERLHSYIYNSNQFAFVALLSVVITIYMFYYKFIGKKIFVINFIGISWIIIKTACRTAFICLIPLGIIEYYLLIKQSKKSTRKQLILFALLFIPFLFQLYQESTVKARFDYRETEANRIAYDTFLDSILGERAIYFHDSLRIIQKNYLFGVGYCNYIRYSSYGTVCHVEYLANLTEGGIMGLVFYLYFLYLLAKEQLQKIKKVHNPQYLACELSSLLTILLFNWGLYTSTESSLYILAALMIYAPRVSLQEQETYVDSASL